MTRRVFISMEAERYQSNTRTNSYKNWVKSCLVLSQDFGTKTIVRTCFSFPFALSDDEGFPKVYTHEIRQNRHYLFFFLTLFWTRSYIMYSYLFFYFSLFVCKSIDCWSRSSRAFPTIEFRQELPTWMQVLLNKHQESIPSREKEKRQNLL